MYNRHVFLKGINSSTNLEKNLGQKARKYLFLVWALSSFFQPKENIIRRVGVTLILMYNVCVVYLCICTVKAY